MFFARKKVVHLKKSVTFSINSKLTQSLSFGKFCVGTDFLIVFFRSYTFLRFRK